MKIDKTKIPDFDSLTAEQKTAIEGMEFPEADYSGYVKKALYDKAASEASEWKKKHNELLSEDERKKQEQNEELENLKAENASLKKEKTISSYTAKLIAQGYSETLAQETASAMYEGDMEKVFANQQSFMSAHDEAIKQNLLKGTPRPPAGDGSSAADYEKRIEQANEIGDFVTVAALTREMQESKNS